MKASNADLDKRLVPLAALQHFAFCPRQCALIHNEQAWAENMFTAQGQLLHQRVDSGDPETRKGVRYERGVLVSAPKLGLTGKLDLLEYEAKSNRYTPVEYKRGRKKLENWDRIQLCAQALCLEEMLNIHINEGALWYWETRRREVVELNEAIRQETLSIIKDTSELLDSLTTPRKVAEKKRCRACSLIDYCQPDLIRGDHSKIYVEDIFIK